MHGCTRSCKCRGDGGGWGRRSSAGGRSYLLLSGSLSLIATEVQFWFPTLFSRMERVSSSPGGVMTSPPPPPPPPLFDLFLPPPPPPPPPPLPPPPPPLFRSVAAWSAALVLGADVEGRGRRELWPSIESASPRSTPAAGAATCKRPHQKEQQDHESAGGQESKKKLKRCAR